MSTPATIAVIIAVLVALDALIRIAKALEGIRDTGLALEVFLLGATERGVRLAPPDLEEAPDDRD